MTLIEAKTIDVSQHFKESRGTVFITHIITLPEIIAALLVDHKAKAMYAYEYKEGEISISLSPIEDDDIRKSVEDVVIRATQQQKDNRGE